MSRSDHQLTIVLEFNCDTDEYHASVWAYPGDVADLVDGPMSLDAIPGARRIIGPVDQNLAMDLYEAICETLRLAGISIQTREVADD